MMNVDQVYILKKISIYFDKAILLYTQEFYQMTLSKLNENGMFVTQCGSGNKIY